MNLSDLKLRLRALIARRHVERELDDELAFHIECETRKHIANGMDPAEARVRARARFGSPALVADECRDARGIAFIDTSMRDISQAFRAFRRAPLSALTITATVGLGLALIVSVFTLYSALYLRADAVRNPDELVEVRRTPRPGAGVWWPLTPLELEAMRRDTAVFTDALGLMRVIDTRIEGRAMRCALVTGNFFQVLGVNAALGRTLAPADDERFAGRQVIVLSHRGWVRLAGGDPEIVGRSVMVNGAPYEVIGVTPEDFRGVGSETAEYWAPASLAAQFRPADAGREDTRRFDTVIGRLRPGLSAQTATAGLTVWVKAIADEKNLNGRFTAITLDPLQPTFSDLVRSLKFFGPIFVAFGLILMIGCANVANLLLARGVARQREIGIRLSLGASRSRIVRQLLTESLLLALVSAACALALSRVILETAVYVLTTTVPAELVESLNLVLPEADWRVVVFLLFGALMSTLFFGLAPALRATRIELVRTMRGEQTKDARPRRARHALVAAQVGASALLLICAGVFLRAAFEAAAADAGVRTTDTLIVGITNESMRPAVIQAIRTEPSIAAVAASWPSAVGFPIGAFVEAQPGGAGTASTRVGIDYRFVSPTYFDVLGIDILKGRDFSHAERIPEAGVAVVSETLAKRLWPGRDPLGQALRFAAAQFDSRRGEEGPPLNVRNFTVVGVARDVRDELTWFGEIMGNGVYLPVNPDVAGTTLTLRAHGDPEQARTALLDRLTRVDPSIGEIRTLRTFAAMETYLLQSAFVVTAVLGCLALLLTVSGLFSVLSYLVEQRRKEIGVRMALGATARDVAHLVLLQTVRPIGFGLVCGCGLAALLATVLMSTRAAAQVGEIVDVFDPAAYLASMLGIVGACLLASVMPVLRAARIDPGVTLKHD